MFTNKLVPELGVEQNYCALFTIVHCYLLNGSSKERSMQEGAWHVATSYKNSLGQKFLPLNNQSSSSMSLLFVCHLSGKYNYW